MEPTMEAGLEAASGMKAVPVEQCRGAVIDATALEKKVCSDSVILDNSLGTKLDLLAPPHRPNPGFKGERPAPPAGLCARWPATRG